jgi:hypothetical protein
MNDRTAQCYSVAVVIAASLLMTSAGCGSKVEDRPTVYSVTGKLTVGGKPLQGITVTLMPVAGGPSGIGKTASDGSFIIVTANAGEGAVPGTHKVILSSYDAAKPDLSRYSSPSGAAPTEDPTKGTVPIPDEYTNFEQTPQTVKVETSGENFLSIEI